jgi:transcriptional regulator with XRE-family HTH domain
MLGAQLRVERHRRGRTQAQLAERADCKARTVGDIERGRRRLERALGLPPGALLAAAGRGPG